MILKRSGARRFLAEDQMPGFSWSYTESTKREIFTITVGLYMRKTGPRALRDLAANMEG